MDRIWNARPTRQADKRPFLDFGDEWPEFTIFLGRFSEDDDLEIIVRKKLPKSSNQQNRYYWGVIVKLISEYTGHTPEEVHAILKYKFLRRRSQEGFEFVPSAMALSTRDREAFHDDCRLWGNVVLGLNIPEPNEYSGE
jgi:hypothetical protein